MKNLDKMIFGYDKEQKWCFLSIDGYQFSMKAETAKEAWKKAYRCYRAEMNPLPYTRTAFCGI